MAALNRVSSSERPEMNERDAVQSEASVAANARYFLEHIHEYESAVSKIDTYATIRQFISVRVAGVSELLDVGNGGVFDYDTAKVGRICAVDLFLGNLPADLIEKYFPKNAIPKTGSALALPEPDAKFDMVLMVMLLHHLTGKDWRTSWINALTALDEAWRVLKPGGKLLIVESCIPSWFFQIEKPALWLLSRLVSSLFSHPITFQFPAQMIADTLRQRSDSVKVTPIPKGKHVLQLGFKVPSFVSPVQPFGFEATKS
jgi:SAM-dependent methyltransferase